MESRIRPKVINGINIKRGFSTLAVAGDSQTKLNPYWITGFCDGESSFVIRISENPKYKAGWKIEARFQIGLHIKDRVILELIQSYFGLGTISKQGKDSVGYRVTRTKDLIKIIDHFNKYPFVTQKQADFVLFKQAVGLIENKEHFTIEKLVAIKAVLNKGLSEVLKNAFPAIVPVTRPLVEDKVIKDPYWLAGFTSGEGCFLVSIYKSQVVGGRETVGLVFKISQHSRDEQFMNSLVSFFGAGNVYKYKEVMDFKITNYGDIAKIIIPFFDKYSIIGVKSQDFEDFKRVAELLKKGNISPLKGWKRFV